MLESTVVIKYKHFTLDGSRDFKNGLLYTRFYGTRVNVIS
jgi:hypothetical protein